MRTLAFLLLLAPILNAESLSVTPRALYVRVALGIERTSDTTLGDRDCSSTRPPALFGCVEGNDGRPLAARGDFGDAPVVEAAIGFEREGRGPRVELALSHRAFELDASANFPGVAGEQPVHGDAESTAAMVVLSLPIPPAASRVQPFLTAGTGIARNAIGNIRYEFPGIAPNAATIIRGGANYTFAWTAGAGATLRPSDRHSVDLTIRYTNLGELRTDAGAATIVRPTRELTLDIAGTRARLQSLGATLSLRWRL